MDKLTRKLFHSQKEYSKPNQQKKKTKKNKKKIRILFNVDRVFNNFELCTHVSIWILNLFDIFIDIEYL